MVKNGLKRLIRLFYPGINTRITVPFLLVVAIVAGIGVFIVTRLVAGSLQERFNNQLVDSARAATNSVTDIEREQLAALRLLVFTEGVPQAIASNDTEQLAEWFRPIAINAILDDVIVYNAEGQGLLQLTRGTGISLEYSSMLPPENLSERSGVQQVLASSSDDLGDKYIDIIINTPFGTLLYLSAPVKDADGRLIGGISTGIRMQRLVELVSEQSLSAVAFYYNDGTVLGDTFRSISNEQLSLGSQRIAQLAELAANGSPTEDLEFSEATYQVLYAPFRLRSKPVGLIAVGLPTNFIVERLSTSRDTLGILFAALFLGVAALGLLMARTITRPIQQLVDTTRAIRDGDLSRRVGLHTPDELGELAASFDHMTDQLVRRNAQVEALYHQQLQETAQRDAVLASIGDPVIVQDLSGKIVLRNQAANMLLDTVRRASHARRVFGEISRQPTAFEQPRSVSFTQQHYSVLAKPVKLPSEEVMGHVIVFHDITELIKAERLKDELILQMSHELRTPLTAARGYADLVRVFEKDNFSEQGGEFVQKMIANLSILERMLNQVVDVSAIIAGQFSIEFRPINIAELLKQCAQEWKETAQERNLDLSLVLPAGDIWVEGDMNRLGQVLDHLVRNACSYTLPGGSIELCAVVKNGTAHVYVMDNGVGIAPEELELVFERMYRGQSAEAGPTDARGLGLGLYLSKHIVKAHQGTLQLESKLDFGTVITMTLPTAKNGDH